MNMEIKICSIIYLLVAICSFACNDDKSGSDEVGQITISVSPSEEIVLDSRGGAVSFTVTPSAPSVVLKYVPSVSWIKNDELAGWTVAENTSKLSREGYIYVLNEKTLMQIGKITIVQKSIDGEIQETPNVSFTEAEVPIEIPFAGNSYVTAPKGSDAIDLYTGKFKEIWADENIVTSSYFYVGGTGNLNLAVVGNNETGSSIVRFKVNDKAYEVSIDGPANKIYGIATIPIEEPGYIKIDMQGVTKIGKSFGSVTGFRIGGEASSGKNYFVTEEKMAEDKLNCYFFRRGASVHWHYTMPDTDVEYFYNEVLVTPENAVNSSYFMMNGFAEGYMGIQLTSSGEHTILFSVWSPYNTDNPEDIPEEKRVKLLRKGKNVTVGEFGHEGSGGQSWLNYEWRIGTVYKALVQVKPDGKGSTIYTAYFYADNEWKLIASFLRPDTDTWYKGAHSFLENFDPINTIYSRSVLFRNQWVRLASGEWREITDAQFTCDNTGAQGLRHDYSGYVDDENCGFVLKSFGFTNDHTEYGKMFTRKSIGKSPDIDISALEKIPSVE